MYLKGQVKQKIKTIGWRRGCRDWLELVVGVV